MVAISVLDLVRIPQGGDARIALDRARRLAVAAEKNGFKRYWVSEHHGMRGIASAATPIVLTHVGASTSSIRIGAGGVMLPNHAPIIVAETFGTMERLYPGRIDLGLGRAHGGVNGNTARALYRQGGAERFAENINELRGYFEEFDESKPVNAAPAPGADVPLWILGTSAYSAQLAASLGLPYAFGGHLLADEMFSAIRNYRAKFKPSSRHERPYVMVGANVFVASTDEEARLLMTTRQMSLTELVRGDLGPSRPPITNMDSFWSPAEKAHVARMMAVTLAGSPDTIKTELQRIIDGTGADEIIAVADIYDEDSRLLSSDLLAQVAGSLCAAAV